MKITLNKKSNDKLQYRTPCLLKSIDSDLIILCTCVSDDRLLTGTVVNPSTRYNIGDYTTSWVKEKFELYEGSITLENDL